ncbi:hypothetical protein R5R35_009976 [Gryllus longicercus]|uniref:Uncharacterized protein n=1 Tax=Gryllus longicercus TaxID=2509291 RepID=A0AAN9V8D6_9ORTH
MGPRVFTLCLLLLLHVGLLSAAPQKQRGCLQECGPCKACAQQLPHTEGCAVQCVLCDICHACFLGKECQWEVRPVPKGYT